MNDANEAQLFSAAPITLKDVICGISCDDGWFDIVYKCSVAIEAVNKKLKPEDQVQCKQIKEKFGTLRYYVGAVPEAACDAVYKAIERAEKASASTCEVCGKARAKLVGSGWVKTLCKPCAAAWEKARGD